MDQLIFAIAMIATYSAGAGISVGMIRFVWLHWGALKTGFWAWMTAIS